MNITADENIDRLLVGWLREAGNNVLWVREVASGMADPDILRRATMEGRVVVTHDKDFGELVFREGMRTEGVVLLRFDAHTAAEMLSLFVHRWPEILRLLPGRFVIAGRDMLRWKHLPRMR